MVYGLSGFTCGIYIPLYTLYTYSTGLSMRVCEGEEKTEFYARYIYLFSILFNIPPGDF